MAFLPEEFRCAEEHAGAHLPAHYVGPLVAQHGEVAPAVNPVLICAPYDCFRCGAHYQFFFEPCFGVDYDSLALGVVLEAVVCHHGAFLGKAFDVLGLAAEERLGNEQGEVCVLHPGGLEHAVEGLLHLLPDGVAVGLDYHAAAHGRLLGEVGLYHEFVVPLRVVFAAFGETF